MSARAHIGLARLELPVDGRLPRIGRRGKGVRAVTWRVWRDAAQDDETLYAAITEAISVLEEIKVSRPKARIDAYPELVTAAAYARRGQGEEARNALINAYMLTKHGVGLGEGGDQLRERAILAMAKKLFHNPQDIKAADAA